MHSQCSILLRAGLKVRGQNRRVRAGVGMLGGNFSLSETDCIYLVILLTNNQVHTHTYTHSGIKPAIILLTLSVVDLIKLSLCVSAGIKPLKQR